MPAPSRPHLVKKFCSDTCRAAFREKKIGGKVEAVAVAAKTVQDHVVDLGLALEHVLACMKGLNEQLAQLQALHGPAQKTKRTKQKA